MSVSRGSIERRARFQIEVAPHAGAGTNAKVHVLGKNLSQSFSSLVCSANLQDGPSTSLQLHLHSKYRVANKLDFGIELLMLGHVDGVEDTGAVHEDESRSLLVSAHSSMWFPLGVTNLYTCFSVRPQSGASDFEFSYCDLVNFCSFERDCDANDSSPRASLTCSPVRPRHEHSKATDRQDDLSHLRTEKSPLRLLLRARKAPDGGIYLSFHAPILLRNFLPFPIKLRLRTRQWGLPSRSDKALSLCNSTSCSLILKSCSLLGLAKEWVQRPPKWVRPHTTVYWRWRFVPLTNDVQDPADSENEAKIHAGCCVYTVDTAKGGDIAVGPADAAPEFTCWWRQAHDQQPRLHTVSSCAGLRCTVEHHPKAPS